MRIFFSYPFGDSKQPLLSRPECIVHRVAYYLSKLQTVQVYCYSDDRPPVECWEEQIRPVLLGSDAFVLFLAHSLGETQKREIEALGSEASLGVDHEHRNGITAAHRKTLIVDLTPPSDGSQGDVKHMLKEQHKILCTIDGSSHNQLDQLTIDGRFTPLVAPISAKGTNNDLKEPLYDGASRWETRAFSLAQMIAYRLNLSELMRPDGLPIGYPYDYEKTIIKEYAAGNGHISSRLRLQQGCPLFWPSVHRIETNSPDDQYPTPISTAVTGDHRDPNARIIVDVRTKYHCPETPSNRDLTPKQLTINNNAGCEAVTEQPCCLQNIHLTFAEAGPRSTLCLPLRSVDGSNLRVGIVVSGGIAPGINAVIAGICRRHAKYAKEQHQNEGDRDRSYALKIQLFRDGFAGLLENHVELIEIHRRDASLAEQIIAEKTRHYCNTGGSWIGTSRFDLLLDSSDANSRERQLEEVVTRLTTEVDDDRTHHKHRCSQPVDILYVIGGDGSMRAATAIARRARQLNKRLSVIGVPKTMDNDILWVWQSFGFLSAVEKAREFLSQLDTETRSNPRLCIAQLFGSDSGFVVSHAALGTGDCKVALIPEFDFTMYGLSSSVRRRLRDAYPDQPSEAAPFGIIVMAETAIPLDVEDYIDNSHYAASPPKSEEAHPTGGKLAVLSLTEEEKERIRRFVGSACINQSDVLDWGKFHSRLVELIYSTAHPFRFSNDITEKLQIALPQRSSVTSPTDDSLSFPVELRSLVLAILNLALRNKDPWGPLPDTVSHATNYVVKQLTEIVSKLDELIARQLRTMNPLNEERPFYERISTFPLQHEARYICTLLLTNCHRKQETRELLNREVHVRLLRRLRVRLLEIRNRYIFEGLLGHELLKPRGAPATQKRVHGQTPDDLRSAGLKIVSRVLEHDIRTDKDLIKRLTYECDQEAMGRFWQRFRVFTNEPRHLLRAIDPSVQDVIFGQRLGELAVDNAMAGYTEFMVSQWLTEFVLVPLDLVVLGRKRVPQEGVFWKSVMAMTQQDPIELTSFSGLFDK